MIVSVPNTKRAGTACRGIVEFVDLYPTLADLCGLTPPKDLDGRSIWHLLDAPDRPGRKAALSWYGAGLTVRTDRWRYTKWKNGIMELFAHENDPLEYHNLAAETEHANVVGKLDRFIPNR